MCGGGGTSTAQAYSVDTDALAQFMTTQAGQAYKDQYSPGNSYAQVGSSIQSYDPSQTSLENGSGQWGKGVVGPDVSGFLTAFNAWNTDRSAAQSAWSNYATLVAQQNGGEGTSTILGNSAPTPYSSVMGNPATPQGPAKLGMRGSA